MPQSLKLYLQPAFLICAVVLAVGAAGMSLAIKSFGLYLKKEPLALNKTLDLLDAGGLGDYKVISKDKITNDDVLKSLGTNDYIQWVLEDTQADEDSPSRKCMLFITYYGLPDRVPHVPEECYAGSGNQQLASSDMDLKVRKNDADNDIPVRYLVFSRANANFWQNDIKFPVMYLFHVNGEYVNSRDGVRFELGRNIRRKYSYFSKVEWNFFNNSMAGKIYPDKQQSVTASEKLLSTILPILEKEHWPNWQK